MEPVGTILFLLLAVVMSGKIARLTRHASAFPSAVQWHIFRPTLPSAWPS